MLSLFYRILTTLGAPFIAIYLWRRRMKGREDTTRFSERLGYASVARPEGRLLWCHAASVGEAASLLALLEKISSTYPSTTLLITTGTVASARMLANRTPPGVIHQYYPVDRPAYVERFIRHWRPDFVLWIESELWPNMLLTIQKHHISAALVNGRMSEKSFRNWYRAQGWARQLLSTFVICLTQTEEDRSHFVALGGKPVRCIGNLKFAANPLPCDEKELGSLRQSLMGRPSWLMASTHHGEEEYALDVHQHLRKHYPDLLTILVPRHTARGDEVAKNVMGRKLSFSRRSMNQNIHSQTEIYLADTMDELGLFYRLSPIACIGGSFVPVGGHNPIEAAHFDCAIIFGPFMRNFSAIAREFIQSHGAIQLQNANELAFTIHRLMSEPIDRNRYALNAYDLAMGKRHVLDQILDTLSPWLANQLS
jgi:3-deoxy-D-manno-octulosonic-acid transferase